MPMAAFRLSVSIVLAAVAAAPSSLLAQTDAERFRQIYETEWAFRLKEFPLLARNNFV